MKTLFADRLIAYDGSQLRSGWIRDEFKLDGEAAVAFTGPCDVKQEFMVDLEDLKAGSEIKAASMLHVIAEHPGTDMARAVLRQRLLVAIAAALLNEMASGGKVLRRGDDLFVGDGKLSVSIATVSPVSELIHFGVNVTEEGVPVRAASLGGLGVEAKRFALELLQRYENEINEIESAKRKSRRVR